MNHVELLICILSVLFLFTIQITPFWGRFALLLETNVQDSIGPEHLQYQMETHSNISGWFIHHRHFLGRQPMIMGWGRGGVVKKEKTILKVFLIAVSNP